MTKLSRAIKTDDVTSGRRDVATSFPGFSHNSERTLQTSWGYGSARAVMGRSAANGLTKKIKKLTNQCLLALRKYLQCRLHVYLLQQAHLTLHNKVVTCFSSPYFKYTMSYFCLEIFIRDVHLRIVVLCCSNNNKKLS